MSDVTFLIKREIFRDTVTLGHMYQDGLHFAYVCEDCDRELEAGGIKVPGATAASAG